MLMYQDLWRGGKEVAKGKRDCDGRYEAIASYLRKNHPSESSDGHLRVLDFGAQGGYFAQRLAEDFDANVVAIDSNRNSLRHLVKHPKIRTHIAYFTPQNVANMGHFDVVLGLSVLHHHAQWKEYLDALAGAGDVVFIEVSNPAEDLPKAPAQGSAADIDAAVSELSGREPIVLTAGYDDRQQRPMYVIDKSVKPEPVAAEPVSEPEPVEVTPDYSFSTGSFEADPGDVVEPVKPRRSRKKAEADLQTDVEDQDV